MSARATLDYQPALDGLRGIAVAGVVAFHLGYLDGGFLGVDLFFTLSGYLITRLLLIERDTTKTVDLAGFWMRRAWRLLPALFLVIFAVAVFAWVEGRPDELDGIREGGIASLVYVTNWYFLASGDGYWNLFSAPTPFDHLWSLAIEEQFYIAWPLVFVALAGRANGRVLAVGTAAATAATALWMAIGDPATVYLDTVARSSSILMGALLGMALHHRWATVEAVLRHRFAPVLSIAACAFLVNAWVRVRGSDDAGFFDGGFFLHSLAVTTLIARVTVDAHGAAARLCSLPPLRWLGMVSYGLYLWHWPIIVILDRDRTGLDGTTLLFLRLAVMVGVTLASFALLERPARRRWSRIRGMTLALPVAAITVALVLAIATRPRPAEAVIGAIPVTTSQTSSPVSPPTTTGVDAATGSPPATVPDDATTTTTTTPALLVTTPTPPTLAPPSPSDPLRILLLGDSYLFDIEPGLVAAFETVPEVDVRPGARLGFAVSADDALAELSAAVAEHRPHLIVTMWARFDAGWLDDRDRDDMARAELEERMVDALEVLASDGAVVVVVGLAPSLGPGVDRVPVDRSINEVFLAASGRVDSAIYLDPDPVVAPDGVPSRWLATETGALLLRKVDVSHYCGDGAARWALALGDLVAAMTDVAPADPADWWAGEWRDDPRYDDPVGACAG